MVTDIGSPAGAEIAQTKPQRFIRFYAAAPVAIAGITVAAVCVMDTSARETCTLFIKSSLLDIAQRVSLCLQQRRLSFCSQGTDVLTTVGTLFSDLHIPLTKLKDLSTALSVVVQNHSEKCKKTGNILQMLDELKEGVVGMGLLVIGPPYAIRDTDMPDFKNAAKMLEHITALTPMLVSHQRAEWQTSPCLKRVLLRSEKLVYTIFISIIVPLSVISSSLTVKTDYELLPGIYDDGKHVAAVLSASDISKFGIMRVEIRSRCYGTESFTLTNELSSFESSVAFSLQQLGPDCVSPLTKTYDQQEDTLVHSFALLCVSGAESSVCPTTLRGISFESLRASSSKVPNGQTAAQTSEPLNRRVKVLVVDDSAMIVKMLSRMLVGIGCDVESAGNGSLALEKLRENFEKFQTDNNTNSVYDIIFMDFLMPVMDGLECMREFQKWRKAETVVDWAFANTLLIGLSATANDVEREKGFEYDMHHFIPKPADSKTITNIHKWKVKGLSVSEIVDRIRSPDDIIFPTII